MSYNKSLVKDSPNELYFFACIPRSAIGISQKHTIWGVYISLELKGVDFLTERLPLIFGLCGGWVIQPSFRIFKSNEYCSSGCRPRPTKWLNSEETYLWSGNGIFNGLRLGESCSPRLRFLLDRSQWCSNNTVHSEEDILKSVLDRFSIPYQPLIFSFKRWPLLHNFGRSRFVRFLPSSRQHALEDRPIGNPPKSSADQQSGSH